MTKISQLPIDNSPSDNDYVVTVDAETGANKRVVLSNLGLGAEAGASVPDGGTTGQVLTKESNADGDADWQDPTGGGSEDATIAGTYINCFVEMVDGSFTTTAPMLNIAAYFGTDNLLYFFDNVHDGVLVRGGGGSPGTLNPIQPTERDTYFSREYIGLDNQSDQTPVLETGKARFWWVGEDNGTKTPHYLVLGHKTENVQSGAYTIQENETLFIDATGDVGFSIASASSQSNGFNETWVIRTDTDDTKTVTFNGTLDGVSNPTMSPGDKWHIISDGSQFHEVNQNIYIPPRSSLEEWRPITAVADNSTITTPTVTNGLLDHNVIIIPPVSEDGVGRAIIDLSNMKDAPYQELRIISAPTSAGYEGDGKNWGPSVYYKVDLGAYLGDTNLLGNSLPTTDYTASPITLTAEVDGVEFPIVLDTDYETANQLRQYITQQFSSNGAHFLSDPVILQDPDLLWDEGLVTVSKGASSSMSIVDYAGSAEIQAAFEALTYFPGEDDFLIGPQRQFAGMGDAGDGGYSYLWPDDFTKQHDDSATSYNIPINNWDKQDHQVRFISDGEDVLYTDRELDLDRMRSIVARTNGSSTILTQTRGTLDYNLIIIPPSVEGDDRATIDLTAMLDAPHQKLQIVGGVAYISDEESQVIFGPEVYYRVSVPGYLGDLDEVFSNISTTDYTGSPQTVHFQIFGENVDSLLDDDYVTVQGVLDAIFQPVIDAGCEYIDNPDILQSTVTYIRAIKSVQSGDDATLYVFNTGLSGDLLTAINTMSSIPGDSNYKIGANKTNVGNGQGFGYVWQDIDETFEGYGNDPQQHNVEYISDGNDVLTVYKPQLPREIPFNPRVDYADWQDETPFNTGNALDVLALRTTRLQRVGTVPANASAAGTTGAIAWDANHIYICTATNTWKRVAIATW